MPASMSTPTWHLPSVAHAHARAQISEPAKAHAAAPLPPDEDEDDDDDDDDDEVEPAADPDGVVGFDSPRVSDDDSPPHAKRVTRVRRPSEERRKRFMRAP